MIASSPRLILALWPRGTAAEPAEETFTWFPCTSEGYNQILIIGIFTKLSPVVGRQVQTTIILYVSLE